MILVEEVLTRSNAFGEGLCRHLHALFPPTHTPHPFFLSHSLALKDIMVLLGTITLCMMFLAVGVEEVFVWMNKKAKASHFWSNVLKAIEKELMVLGIISFLLFMFEQVCMLGRGDGVEGLGDNAD